MRSELMDETIRLMKARPHGSTYRELSTATGIHEGWLRALQNGKIKEPSVVRIETLYQHLSGNALEV